MIGKLATCTRCSKIIYLVEEVGLRWTADLEPLDAQEAVSALVSGRQVYRVTQPGTRLSTARPGVLKALREAEPSERPIVVGSHPCPEGAARPLTPVQGGGEGLAPKASGRPPVPPSRPSLGLPTGGSTVKSADRRGTETLRGAPKCDTCGQPCEDGTYGAIQLGDLYVWAQHVNACG